MTAEICLFNKYGFCRNGDKCHKTHLKEVCHKRECESKKCDKRHPRPCKFQMQNGFCKFDSKCNYSHRLPKMIEDQNLRIEALERKLEDQNETIKGLKVKILENQKSEVEKLQTQINHLKLKNKEKEIQIQKLDELVNKIDVSKDVTMVTDDTLQETIVSPSKASFASARNEIFVENSLKHLEDMESDIKKSRKMSIIKEKYKVYCDKIEEEFDLYEIKSTIYEMAVKRLKEFLNSSEAESTKEQCFKCIDKCKMLLNS